MGKKASIIYTGRLSKRLYLHLLQRNERALFISKQCVSNRASLAGTTGLIHIVRSKYDYRLSKSQPSVEFVVVGK